MSACVAWYMVTEKYTMNATATEARTFATICQLLLQHSTIPTGQNTMRKNTIQNVCLHQAFWFGSSIRSFAFLRRSRFCQSPARRSSSAMPLPFPRRAARPRAFPSILPRPSSGARQFSPTYSGSSASSRYSLTGGLP